MQTNTLTFGHLATLPKRNKDHFISAFTQEQKLFLQQYLYEGQRVARSWHISEPMSPPPPASPKNVPQLGFGTPVLRARLDRVSTRMDTPINIRHNHTGSKENKRPPGHSAKSWDAVKHAFNLKEEWKKKNISRFDKEKRSKEHNLTSDSENELAERRADRRQRKKIKRNIMNSEICGDGDNEDKPRKQAKRQSKLHQEFALMHGFSSTNVGKNRLTLNPGRRDIGVFQKGKASEKTDVIQARKRRRQESGLHFSEATFLAKPRQKVSKIDFEKMTQISTTMEEDSTVVSSSASTPRPTITRTDPNMVKVRSRKFKDSKAPSKSKPVSKPEPQSQDKAQTGYNPADSIVWDIEEAEPVLDSEVSSGVKQGTIVLELAHLPVTSKKVLGNESLNTNITTLEAHVGLSEQKSLSVIHSDAFSSPLAPSQSASQTGLRTANVVSLPPTSSKYFKPLPPSLAEPHLASRYTIHQLDTKPSAFTELGEPSTIEDIPQLSESASHLPHSPGLSARSYCDGQEGRPNFIPPMQPSCDMEASVYYDSSPGSDYWFPVDNSGRLDNMDDIVDHVSVGFDGQINPSFVNANNDREVGDMDQIHDASFISLSRCHSTEPYNSIPSPLWLSDACSDALERSQGVVYQYSEWDGLLPIDLGSEDQQIQPDSNFNLEYDGALSKDLKLYPDVVHHFWQGRSLLYGLSTPEDSSSFHKLSNVEADVARQLQLDHWQPQKL